MRTDKPVLSGEIGILKFAKAEFSTLGKRTASPEMKDKIIEADKAFLASKISALDEDEQKELQNPTSPEDQADIAERYTEYKNLTTQIHSTK